MTKAELADKVNRMLSDKYEMSFSCEAKDISDMFWPLVVAAEKVCDDSYCTSTSCLGGKSQLDCIECSSGLLNPALTKLRES